MSQSYHAACFPAASGGDRCANAADGATDHRKALGAVDTQGTRHPWRSDFGYAVDQEVQVRSDSGLS